MILAGARCASPLQRYFEIYAFSAWRTPGNNLGTAFARSPAGERTADQPLEGDVARAMLLELLRSAFEPARLERAYCLQILAADFPSGRSFEVRLEVSATPRAADDPNCP